MNIEEINYRLATLKDEMERAIEKKTNTIKELNGYQRIIDERKVLINYYEGLKDSINKNNELWEPWEE